MTLEQKLNAVWNSPPRLITLPGHDGEWCLSGMKLGMGLDCIVLTKKGRYELPGDEVEVRFAFDQCEPILDALSAPL